MSRSRARSISPLTCWLWLLLGVHVILVPAALSFAFGTPRSATVARQVERFIERRQSADSWEPMESARQIAAVQAGGAILARGA